MVDPVAASELIALDRHDSLNTPELDKDIFNSTIQFTDCANSISNSNCIGSFDEDDLTIVAPPPVTSDLADKNIETSYTYEQHKHYHPECPQQANPHILPPPSEAQNVNMHHRHDINSVEHFQYSQSENQTQSVSNSSLCQKDSNSDVSHSFNVSHSVAHAPITHSPITQYADYIDAMFYYTDSSETVSESPFLTPVNFPKMAKAGILSFMGDIEAKLKLNSNCALTSGQVVCEGLTGCDPLPSHILRLAQMKRPINIHVEGIIGAGKTYMMDHLKLGPLEPYIQFFEEPLSKWRDLKGENLLEQFYSNPVNMAATFHQYVYHTLLENHLSLCNKPIKMMERSIHSCMEFARLQHSFGNINNTTMNIMEASYELAKNRLNVNPDIIIYIDASIQQSSHNIRARSRKEEVIDLDYLEKLRNSHRTWICNDICLGQNVSCYSTRYFQFNLLFLTWCFYFVLQVIVLQQLFVLKDVELFLLRLIEATGIQINLPADYE